MKNKKLYIFWGILFSLTCAKMHVLADTITPDLIRGKAKVGMEISMEERDFSGQGQEYSFQINRYQIKGEYAFEKQFSVFGKLGIIDVSSDEFAPVFDEDKFNINPGLSFSLGIKTSFIKVNNFEFGMSLQATRFDIKNDEISSPEGHIISSDDNYQNAYWIYGLNGLTKGMEYDICIGGNYRTAHNIIVYGGLLFSKVNADLNFEITTPTPESFEGYHNISAKEQEKFKRDLYDLLSLDSNKRNYEADESETLGIILGGTMNILDHFELGLEGKLMNQTSFSFYGNYLF